MSVHGPRSNDVCGASDALKSLSGKRFAPDRCFDWCEPVKSLRARGKGNLTRARDTAPLAESA
eukprot:640910-Amorphochlora_amoeboformis.AAC.1